MNNKFPLDQNLPTLPNEDIDLTGAKISWICCEIEDHNTDDLYKIDEEVFFANIKIQVLLTIQGIEKTKKGITVGLLLDSDEIGKAETDEYGIARFYKTFVRPTNRVDGTQKKHKIAARIPATIIEASQDVEIRSKIQFKDDQEREHTFRKKKDEQIQNKNRNRKIIIPTLKDRDNSLKDNVYVITASAVTPTMAEAKLVKWLKQNGDYVAENEAIYELETEKATVQIEALASGILKIKVEEGERIKVGDVLGTILQNGKKQNKQDTNDFKPHSRSDQTKKNNKASSQKSTQTEIPDEALGIIVVILFGLIIYFLVTYWSEILTVGSIITGVIIIYLIFKAIFR